MFLLPWFCLVTDQAAEGNTSPSWADWNPHYKQGHPLPAFPHPGAWQSTGTAAAPQALLGPEQGRG